MCATREDYPLWRGPNRKQDFSSRTDLISSLRLTYLFFIVFLRLCGALYHISSSPVNRICRLCRHFSTESADSADIFRPNPASPFAPFTSSLSAAEFRISLDGRISIPPRSRGTGSRLTTNSTSVRQNQIRVRQTRNLRAAKRKPPCRRNAPAVRHSSTEFTDKTLALSKPTTTFLLVVCFFMYVPSFVRSSFS